MPGWQAHLAAVQTQNADANAAPRNLKIAGQTAEITISGLLTKRPSFIAWLLGIGGTTYRDIASAFGAAVADPGVKQIVFDIDSPGGQMDGYFELVDILMAGSAKPMSVLASNAMSAAYGLATAIGKIEARSAGSRFGSVGVAVDLHLDPNAIEIASTAAPLKRPDPKTEAGIAAIRAELDQLHGLFAAGIAKGRGVTVATVNSEFGRGGTFLAKEAQARGMIDSIRAGALRAIPKRATATGEKPMKFEEFAAAHPDEARRGTEAAHAAGVKTERERATAHLQLAEKSGQWGLAVAAVKDGKSVDGVTAFEHFEAKSKATANAGKIDERQTASDEVAGKLDGTSGSESGASGAEAKDKQFLAAYAAHRGSAA